jgi:3-oxoacyl-[acyl-carrier protein] reductase
LLKIEETSTASSVQHLILTGGSGGLGTALRHAFADSTWEITAPTRMELDVGDVEAIRPWFYNRPVDLLICCAGLTEDSLLLKMDESSWDRVQAVNFQGAAACAKAAIPRMQKSGCGHVIFISSHSALHPRVGQTAYATAKAALLGLTDSLSKTYGDYNIRVNAILPGFMETKMTRSLSSSQRAEILKTHALGRFNTPETVAKFCRFLHESLPETSGQILQLDSRSVI